MFTYAEKKNHDVKNSAGFEQNLSALRGEEGELKFSMGRISDEVHPMTRCVRTIFESTTNHYVQHMSSTFFVYEALNERFKD